MNTLNKVGIVTFFYLSHSFYGQTFDSLKENKIEEVVVIGYGKTRAKDLTGSVSNVKLSDAIKQPVADIGQALQGRAAGVHVVTSGEPGSNVNFRIRGTGTITGNNPLIVVDGMPLNGGLNQINMNDVESLTVLKDASSTAIYGSRGANGVIMITTKKGTTRNSLNFDMYTGVQLASNLPNMLNASEYVALNNDLLQNAGINPNPEFSNPAEWGEGTNWVKELFRPSVISNYSISYGTRSEKANIYVSGNYFNQQGVVINTNYERFNFQINSDVKVNSKLRIGNNLKLNHDVKENGAYDIRNSFLALPTQTIYDEFGNYTGPIGSPYLSGDIENPIGKAKNVDMSTKGYNIQGNAYVEYDIIKDLKFKSIGGVELNLWYDRTWSPKYKWGSKSQENSYLFEGSYRSSTLLWDNTLTYDKKIGDHNVTAVGGSSAQQNKYHFLSGSIQKFASDHTQQIDNGVLQPTIGGNASDWAILSFFGRVNYSYQSKYYLTATVRRDGSSRFGRGNKWGWFPSTALAWRLSEENFLKDSNAIDDLKLRLGYGITGNQDIGNYAFASSYQTNLYNFNGGHVSAVLPTVLPNPNVKWEGQEQYNIGVDLSLYNKRISLILDGYIKNTNDMLVPMSVPVTSGYSDIYVPSINAGKIENKGFEAQLSTKNFIGDFSWNTDVVFSYNKNKVVAINSDSPIISGSLGLNSTVGLVQAGYPINIFYGYLTDGIFQTQEQVNQYALQTPGSSSTTSTAPGDIRFKDLNNDGIINDKDRTFLGNPNPKFTYSINNDFNYKNWNLTIYLQGSYGNDIFNANRMYTENMSIITNQSKDVLSRWNGVGTSNTMPRAIFGDPNNNARVSDRYIEDGSYLKVKNVTLGYTFENGFLAEKIKTAKIYFSAQNLLTFTHYSGIDPEVPINGIDNAVYPVTSTYSLGINLTF